MNRKLLSKADDESVGITERAIEDLRKLGATMIDPGPERELFKSCIARQAPELLNSAFARQYRQLFPVDASGQPAGDQIATLVDLRSGHYDFLDSNDEVRTGSRQLVPVAVVKGGTLYADHRH